jgi:hypothetical protein
VPDIGKLADYLTEEFAALKTAVLGDKAPAQGAPR